MRGNGLANYLRTERLRSGLTQQELAELLGISRSAIAKLENARAPSVRIALAVGIVFGLRPHAIFPAYYDTLLDVLLLRAFAIENRLVGKSDPVSERKRAHLNNLINRIQFHDFP